MPSFLTRYEPPTPSDKAAPPKNSIWKLKDLQADEHRPQKPEVTEELLYAEETTAGGFASLKKI